MKSEDIFNLAKESGLLPEYIKADYSEEQDKANLMLELVKNAVLMFATRVADAEREEIIDEWWSCVQSDLENGVKSLNEKASREWQDRYPAMSGFGDWLQRR